MPPTFDIILHLIEEATSLDSYSGSMRIFFFPLLFPSTSFLVVSRVSILLLIFTSFFVVVVSDGMLSVCMI